MPSGYIKSTNGDRIEIVDATARAGMIKHINEDGTMTAEDVIALEDGLYYSDKIILLPCEHTGWYACGIIIVYSQNGKVIENRGKTFGEYNEDKCIFESVESLDGYGSEEANRIFYIEWPKIYNEATEELDYDIGKDGQVLMSNGDEDVYWVDMVTDDHINSLIDAKLQALDGTGDEF